MDIHARAPRRILPALAAAFLALSVTACDFTDEGGPRIDSAAEARELPEDADDVFAIQTENDVMKLGLTDEVVYMRFSDEKLEEIDRDLDADQRGDGGGSSEGGIGGAIASAVKGAVSKGLRTRISYEVDNVRDVRYENGRLVVELQGGDTAFGDLDVDGDDVTLLFAEDDVRDFAERFREVKARRNEADAPGAP